MLNLLKMLKYWATLNTKQSSFIVLNASLQIQWRFFVKGVLLSYVKRAINLQKLKYFWSVKLLTNMKFKIHFSSAKTVMGNYNKFIFFTDPAEHTNGVIECIDFKFYHIKDRALEGLLITISAFWLTFPALICNV